MISSSKRSLITLIIIAGLSLSTAAAVTSAHPAVDIAVKNWSFTPATVEAHVGEATLLRFTSSEGVHGVESDEIGLKKTTLVPDKVTEVSFTPKTAGTFVVHCAIICGEGHDKMVLTVKVAK